MKSEPTTASTLLPPSQPPGMAQIVDITCRPGYPYTSIPRGGERMRSYFLSKGLPLKEGHITSGCYDDGHTRQSSSTSKSFPQPLKVQYQTAADIHGNAMKEMLNPGQTLNKNPPNYCVTGLSGDYVSKVTRSVSASTLPSLPTRTQNTVKGCCHPDLYTSNSPRSNIGSDGCEPYSRNTTRISSAEPTPAIDNDDCHTRDDVRRKDGIVFPTSTASSSQGYTTSPTANSSRINTELSIPTTGTFQPSHSSTGTIPTGGVLRTSFTSSGATPGLFNTTPNGSIHCSLLHKGKIPCVNLQRITKGTHKGRNIQSSFACRCCPKKPKRFTTWGKLAAHEAEKPYKCPSCSSHFKTKNDAKRHHVSIHLRKQSWSCSALIHPHQAFFSSTNSPGECDTCSYCGKEFIRSGRKLGSNALDDDNIRHATEEDWEERARHLEKEHKFGQCNYMKIFYRADHFRQHIKYSHTGTSGKWTSILERTCFIP